MADFENKVVIITGASSGIGARTAEFLATQGAWLALVGRNAENLKSVADKCTPTHGAPEPLQIIADVTNEADAKRIIDTTVEKFQKINVLVNNAGILKRGTIETATLQDYDAVMNVNVRSIFHLTQLAVPHLIATKGNIVNVSSVNGMRSFPGVLAYNISKSALDQFTQCVALELADRGVRVNSVNPGKMNVAFLNSYREINFATCTLLMQALLLPTFIKPAEWTTKPILHFSNIRKQHMLWAESDNRTKLLRPLHFWLVIVLHSSLVLYFRVMEDDMRCAHVENLGNLLNILPLK